MNRKVIDSILKGLIWLAAFLTISILAWILIYVIYNGIGHVDLEFLTQSPKGEAEGGVFPMIVSTLYIVLLSVAISTPIGICSAIYLVEYAKPGKVVRLIRFATESLAGIPSIIYGLFGFIFFVVLLKLRWSLISGALTLSIMVLPTIIRTTEEALKSVPNIYREGSLGLGVSKLRTIRKVILPSAIPGILTGVILSVGRIVGETAAVIFTAGMVPRIPNSILSSGRTLSVHMFLLAQEGISFDKAYATATVLIFIILIINFIANRIAKRMNKGKVL